MDIFKILGFDYGASEDGVEVGQLEIIIGSFINLKKKFKKKNLKFFFQIFSKKLTQGQGHRGHQPGWKRSRIFFSFFFFIF